MDTLPPGNLAAVYRERLQQAVRVMEQLSERQRLNNFDINIVACDSDDGVVGCVAGLCGLDPWFQERGLVTDVQNGNLSMGFVTFFGTSNPFLPSHYRLPRPVTVDDAIAALTRAIDALHDDATASDILYA